MIQRMKPLHHKLCLCLLITALSLFTVSAKANEGVISSSGFALPVLDVGLGAIQASSELQRIYEAWFGAEGLVNHPLAESDLHIITTAVLAFGVSFLIFAAAYVYRARKIRRNLHETIAEREQTLLELDRFLNQTSELTNNLTAIIGFDGYFKRLNLSWEKVLGYTIEELQDKPFLDFIHPDDHERSLAAAKQIVEQGTLSAFENRYRCKDGSYRVFEWSANSYLDGDYLFAIATDITERKLAHETLRQSEENFRVIAQSSPVSIVIARSSDSTIIFANPQAGEFFGLAPHEMIGRQTYELYQNPDDRAFIVSLLKKVGRVRNLELWLKKTDGTSFLGMVSFETLRYGGEDAILSAIMDVTTQRDTQEQLVQAAKLATLGELASGITHELNQPLSIVRMAAEAAEMELHEPEPNKELMEKKLLTVIDQSDRMGSIINHMRQFSRKDTGPLEIFAPLRPVKAAIALLEHQFKIAGIQLEVDFPTICRNLYGQAVRLEQVMLNLLANAKDSVSDKKAQMDLSTTDYVPRICIEVKDELERDVIYIRVTDNGAGLPQPYVGTIFDPFYTTKKEGEGTGLGLSISYSIINSMGGDIEAIDQDEGARFEITIPVNSTHETEYSQSELTDAAPPGEQDEYRFGARSILIVDDEVLAAESIAEYLERNGCLVYTANNGAEALEIYHHHPTDVVITDLRMPLMDGNELIRLLRKQNQKLPIIVTTGHTMIGDDEEIIAEGANVVLKKPVRLREILTQVETICAKQN